MFGPLNVVISDVKFDMEQFKCRNCGKETSDFRIIHPERPCPSRSLDCRGCEREKAKRNRNNRYKTEEGKKAILESNKRYVKKPGMNEKLSEKGKKKYAEDLLFKNKVKDKNRAWRAANPERKKLTAKKHFQAHKDEIRRKARLKRLINPLLRLRNNVRTRVWESIKSGGKSKNGSSVFKHLKYSANDLFKHLETHENWDKSWMSMFNYGSPKVKGGRSWSLDHIVPQSMFGYSSMDDDNFHLCWKPINLRPVESRINTLEGNKRNIFGDFDQFDDIMQKLQEYINGSHSSTTPSDIKNHFKNIKLIGSCPMTLCGLDYLDDIFYSRFMANTVSKKSLIEASKDKNEVLKVLVYLVSCGKPITIPSVFSNLKFITKVPGHFFPGAAYSIYDKYALPGVSVFDPFLGWGGRTLGALCANVHEFVGCDLQSGVVDGCKKIYDDFKPLSTTSCEFHQQNCLDFLRSSEKKFGLIFASPPYMNYENYNVKSDLTSGECISEFILPFIGECKKHLLDNGKLILHLKDVKGAPAFTAYFAVVTALGFKQIEHHKYGRNSSQSICVFEP
jgi:hypothetical protein